MIFWEDIVEAYQDILDKTYFIETLKIALRNFAKLKPSNYSAFGSFGQNMEDKLSGLEILNNSSVVFFIGRKGGLNGPDLRQDRDSGGWRTFKYEVNFTENAAPNRNWFSSKEFVEFMKAETVVSESLPVIFHSDPWHFSHLGKEYFEKIAQILGYGKTLDCPIKSVYTGNKGVKYEDKNIGRKINPNWWVLLLNEKQVKYGTTTGNKIVEGNCSTDGYKRTSWSEIKNYEW